jgi:crossover junction endodeoxyribonuclease RuvC
MVTRILNLEVAPKPADAADALAIAICHAWRGASQDRIAAQIAKTTQIAQSAR